MSILKYLPYSFREKHHIFFHSQNLNERNGWKGSKWRHGRAWLHGFNNCIGLCWAFFWNSSTGIGITLGGEDEITLHVAVWRLFALWLHVNHILPRKWTRQWEWWDRSWGRTTDIRIFDGSIWLNIHNDTTGWHSSQKFPQEFNFDFVDFLLGRSKVTTKILDQGESDVPMIEGNYRVKWQKLLKVWKRPRWPFAQRIVAFDMDLQKPIPVPGKGENSYDCDDDAIHSMYCPAQTLEEAISKLTASALRTRRKYGWDYDKVEYA